MNKDVYIIPVNAPLPAELGQLPLPTGTFAARVAAVEETGGILALSPAEIAALAQSPEVFNLGPATTILGIQGAFYDPLFTASSARYGAKTADWDTMQAEFRRETTAVQRQEDKTPWAAERFGGKPTAPARERPVMTLPLEDAEE